MKLSFDKFFALTMTLAAGASLTTGCVVEDSDDDGAAGSPGSSETAGTSGSEDEGQAGAAGDGSPAQAGSAGTPSSEGVGGSAGTPSSEGGIAGAAGTPSSEGAGGSAGTPSSEGGIAGGAGTPSSEGGIAGGAGTPSSEGAIAGGAGTPSSEGLGGSAGGPSGEGGAAGAAGGTCVSGDPALESGVDCSTALPYADETCPNPSGESMLPLGITTCWQYSEERQGSVAVLVECLQQIDGADGGYCGEAHEQAVKACVDEMEARTCPSPTAQTSCVNIAAACADVTQAECVADLSMLSDASVLTVEACAGPSAEGGSIPASTCAYQYRRCRGIADEYIPVDEACAMVKESCSDVDSSACETRLDIYEGGALLEWTFYSSVLGCMETAQEVASVTCSAAYETCTAVWAE